MSLLNNIFKGGFWNTYKSIHVGNNYNLPSGISNDYRRQINEITDEIYSFKPKTALNRITTLLKSVEQNNSISIEDKNGLLADLYFLEATCLRDLRETEITEISKGYIKAYNHNPKYAPNACEGYLNLNEIDKAEELAHQIIDGDEFNFTAWLVLAILSNDINGFIQRIPNTLLDDNKFNTSLIYNLFRSKPLNYFDQIENLGLSFEAVPSKYEEFNYKNRFLWLISIDLLINKHFYETPVKIGQKDHQNSSDENKLLLKLISEFVSNLSKTEISHTIKHQKFYQLYFEYSKNQKQDTLQSLKNLYEELPSPFGFYTNLMCKTLLEAELPSEALDVLISYEEKETNLEHTFFFTKARLLLILENEIPNKTIKNFLDSITDVDESVALNILMFTSMIQDNLHESDKIEYQQKVRSLNFENEVLKEVVLICVDNYLNLLENIEERFKELQKKYENSDIPISKRFKILYADSLMNLNKFKEAFDFLKSNTDATKSSEELHYYLTILIHIAHSEKNDDFRKLIFDELKPLLKFWRENGNYEERFLFFEHNIYVQLNKWDELLKIDKILHELSLDNEEYLQFYIVALDNNKKQEELKNISNQIPVDFQEEVFGLNIAQTFLKYDDLKEIGAEVLFRLSKNPDNIQARREFMILTHLFPINYFDKKEKVEEGDWIHCVGQNFAETIKVKSKGKTKKFIGKSIGDKTSVTGNNHRTFVVEIVDIFGEKIKLLRELHDELKSPMNDLGGQMMNLPESGSIEALNKYLMDEYGYEGEQYEKEVKMYLNDYFNYKVGFSEVSRIFKDNPIDTYYILTQDSSNKFTSLPLRASASILKSENRQFGIDFTSLMLFYELEKNLEIKFERKYVISSYLKQIVEEILIETKTEAHSELSVQVRTDKVIPHFFAPDFKEKRISMFEDILKWIEDNCFVDYVEEKLHLKYRLAQEEKSNNGIGADLLVDNMLLSSRDNLNFISNDSSLYLFKFNNQIRSNIINPVMFLNNEIEGVDEIEIQKYLLKNNYIGLSVLKEVLTSEYIHLLSGKNNCFTNATLSHQVCKLKK